MGTLTELKDTRYGKMIYLKGDQYIGQALDRYGEFSEFEALMFRQLVAAGDVVFDIGANIGAHTVYFSQLVGPSGAVVAFEPQPVIHLLLCANLALNECFNARPMRVGLGAAAGSARVPPVDYSAVNNFGGLPLILDEAAAGETVPVRTLDSFEIARAKLLKIDVEGMEIGVLRGAIQTINRLRPTLYVENDRRPQSPALIALLQEMGYRMWWHLPPLFNPNNFFGVAENAFPGVVSINLLCLPRELAWTVTAMREVTGPDDWWEAE